VREHHHDGFSLKHLRTFGAMAAMALASTFTCQEPTLYPWAHLRTKAPYLSRTYHRLLPAKSLDKLQIFGIAQVLFEDVSREQPPAEPSSTELLTAELLAPEQWAPRPGSFAPLVPQGAEPEQSEEAQKPDQPAAPVTAVQVLLLLGGLIGADGTVTSAGMFRLASMLRALPDTTVTTYNWNNWPDAYRAILANQGKAKIVVIGYSGGGSRATWLANMPSKPQIDLMVHYAGR
jgi:hypothetical protein